MLVGFDKRFVGLDVEKDNVVAVRRSRLCIDHLGFLSSCRQQITLPSVLEYR